MRCTIGEFVNAISCRFRKTDSNPKIPPNNPPHFVSDRHIFTWEKIVTKNHLQRASKSLKDIFNQTLVSLNAIVRRFLCTWTMEFTLNGILAMNGNASWWWAAKNFTVDLSLHLWDKQLGDWRLNGPKENVFTLHFEEFSVFTVNASLSQNFPC